MHTAVVPETFQARDLAGFRPSGYVSVRSSTGMAAPRGVLDLANLSTGKVSPEILEFLKKAIAQAEADNEETRASGTSSPSWHNVEPGAVKSSAPTGTTTSVMDIDEDPPGADPRVPPCKYYKVVGNSIVRVDTNQILTPKQAKKLRQKERDEGQAKSSADAAMGLPTANADRVAGKKAKAQSSADAAMGLPAAEAGRGAGKKAMGSAGASSGGGANGAAAGSDPVTGLGYAPKKGCNKSKREPGQKLVTGKLIPTWPLVPCCTTGCTTELRRWSRMREVRNVLRYSAGVYGDDDDDVQVYYFCASCMAKEWEMSEQEAQAKILEERPGWERKVRDNQAFAEADAKTATAFPGLSKGERRLITVASMT